LLTAASLKCLCQIQRNEVFLKSIYLTLHHACRNTEKTRMSLWHLIATANKNNMWGYSPQKRELGQASTVFTDATPAFDALFSCFRNFGAG